jgi:putative flippase GtrA
MSFLIYGLGWAETNAGLLSGRVIPWAVAMTLTYFLNAKLTFGASIRYSRFINYIVIQAIGAGINLGTYSGLVLFGPLKEGPLIAMIVGNVLAIVNNFLLVRKFVYRYHPEVDDSQ